MNQKQPKKDPKPEKIQTELKRCISRLSYVGMGLSPELDQSLAELRQIIKSNESEKKIKKNIDKISKVLRTMEDKPELKSLQVEMSVKEVDVLQLLLEEKLPVKLKIGLKKQQGKLPSKKAADIVVAIVSAINQFLAEMENNPLQVIPQADALAKNTQVRTGFFARLFSRIKALGSEQEKLEAIKPSPKLPEELKTSLQHLVDQLSAMQTYSEVAAKLTKQLKHLNSVNQLSGILESIAGAFVEVSGLEHKQFESFLKSLNKRLDRVNQFINNTVSYSQQVKDESGLLDQELKSSVSSIKQSVESSTSLTEVKQNIYHKMDNIVDRVDSFYKQQEQSQQKLNHNLDKLQDQLRATEDESIRLREDLAAQKERAQTDPLTQLPNRYSYNEQLTQEYNRWRRYRSPLSLVIGDIDFFKKVNDQYGHSSGDEVLKQLSEYLQNELRESDFIARFGGEEFVILLPETNIIDATKAINKLRQGIKEIKVESDNNIIQVAMSFGISEFEEDDTPKTVFDRADKALYRAKQKGRDQVCCQRAKKSS